MNEPTDEIIEAAQRGDRDAQDALARWSMGPLQGYVRRRMGGLLRSLESSADLAQSVCAEVLTDLPRFESGQEDGFRRWLMTCAERKILKRCRFHSQEKRDSKRRTPQSDTTLGSIQSADSSPSQQAMMIEEIGRLEEALDKLPEDYREVIVLTRLVGHSHEEAAKRMGKTVPATWTLLSRALARLAVSMEDDEP